MNERRMSVIIADDEPITRLDMREVFEAKGFNVVDAVSDGFDAIKACRKYHPDLVLMDIKMPLLDGLSAARIINEEECVGTIVLMSAYSEKEYLDSAKENGIDGYWIKPIDEKSLMFNVELLIERKREVCKIKKDMQRVTTRLENREVIEKAKGRLMGHGNISEMDAYNFIRKVSQDKNIPMRRVAEYVLAKYGG